MASSATIVSGVKSAPRTYTGRGFSTGRAWLATVRRCRSASAHAWKDYGRIHASGCSGKAPPNRAGRSRRLAPGILPSPLESSPSARCSCLRKKFCHPTPTRFDQACDFRGGSRGSRPFRWRLPTCAFPPHVRGWSDLDVYPLSVRSAVDPRQRLLDDLLPPRPDVRFPLAVFAVKGRPDLFLDGLEQR